MEVQVFFLSGISVYLSQYFFRYIKDFFMKSRVCFTAYHQLFREKEIKKGNFGAVFFILKFLKLPEIWIQILGFQYQLKHTFKFKAFQWKAIQPGALLDRYLQPHKVTQAKVRVFLVTSGYKSSILSDQGTISYGIYP